MRFTTSIFYDLSLLLWLVCCVSADGGGSSLLVIATASFLGDLHNLIRFSAALSAFSYLLDDHMTRLSMVFFYFFFYFLHNQEVVGHTRVSF